MIEVIQVDSLQFTRVFQNIRDLVRKGLVDPELGTVSKQSQLLLDHCIRLTPPKSASEGKRRVRLDVEKIFHPIDPAQMRSPALAKLVRRSDPAAWNAMARKVSTGPLAGTEAVIPTSSLHFANRDRRGRAKRTHYVTLWKQRGALKEIIKAAQDRVGWARAGWLRAYQGLGGIRVAAWFGRHGQVRGIFEDGRSAPNPYIAAYNNTGWGKAGESKRIVTAAMQARRRAMESYFNATMRLAAEAKPTQWQAQMRAIAAMQTAA